MHTCNWEAKYAQKSPESANYFTFEGVGELWQAYRLRFLSANQRSPRAAAMTSAQTNGRVKEGCPLFGAENSSRTSCGLMAAVV